MHISVPTVCVIKGDDSSVGIVMGYDPDGPNSIPGRDNFFHKPESGSILNATRRHKFTSV